MLDGRRALVENNIAPAESWSVWGGSDLDAGYAGMVQLLRHVPDLTAVVISNVVSAIGAISAVDEAGLRVPDDLSIVAIHDTPFALHARPALTVVQMPLPELGRQAIEMLLADESPAGRELVITKPKPILIERASNEASWSIERKRPSMGNGRFQTKEIGERK